MSLAWRSYESVLDLDATSALGEFLAARLHERRGDEHLIVSLPAPVVAPERLWELGRDPGFVWDPPSGPAFSGLGPGIEIPLSGSSRFADLRRQAERHFARIRQVTHPSAVATRPRFFGGFSFEVGGAEQWPWRGLGDGCFCLPRIGYESTGDRAALSFLTTGADDALAREALVERALEILRRLGETPTPNGRLCHFDPEERHPSATPAPQREAAHDPDFVARVAAIVAAIGRGELEKVVAARHRVVELREVDGRNPVWRDPVTILRRLARPGEGRPLATRFGFRHLGTTFLGATPERLVRKFGDQVETEALAGSSRSGHNAELLQSGKDLREHQLVVDDILHKLRPLCAQLLAPPQPTVRELRDVLHLLTPIVGRLQAPCHVLDLVAELHPTPAIAGVPTAAAVQWIREHEPFARGWYAGPIGYFDAAGDGDFSVALRSCVIAGDQAHLFAGAGIVGDSDPVAELAETELKQQALLAALVGEPVLVRPEDRPATRPACLQAQTNTA